MDGAVFFHIHDAQKSDYLPFIFDALYLEKPIVFDPRGQAMLTLTGKI